jgi:hypothetical protein
MKGCLKCRRSIVAVVALVLGLVVLATAAFAQTDPQNPGVFAVTSAPFGFTYGEWSAKWWQYVFSIPVPKNPLLDQTGKNCAEGQSGPVFFLVGVINTSGTAVRNCTVPAGKALFFPVLNVECSTLEGDGTTEQQLRDCAKHIMDGATGMACDVDGVSIKNLQRFRVESGLFQEGPLPNNNLEQLFGFNAPAGTVTNAFADGVYLMLEPPTVGNHTVHFHGSFPAFNFTLDIVYHLIVK